MLMQGSPDIALVKLGYEMTLIRIPMMIGSKLYREYRWPRCKVRLDMGV